jgi:biopolymer transport protein ExbD
MPLKTYQDEHPSPNLTPMIDIVFLLIIFFMVGTKFVEMERKIAVKVPQVTDAGALTPASEKWVVNVHRDGQISLDGQFVTLDELKSALATACSQPTDLGVIVRPDAEGDVQNMATVLNACSQAGVTDIGLSVTSASKDGVIR